MSVRKKKDEGLSDGKKGRLERVINVLLVCLGVIFLTSAGTIGYYLYHMFAHQSMTKKLQRLAYVTAEPAGRSGKNAREDTRKNARKDTSGSGSQKEGTSDKAVIDFTRLKQINPDVSAWLKLPGTSIDAPVLCDHKDETDYYLHRNIYGKKDAHGSLYHHYGRSFGLSGTVTPVYGHHMRDGTMLAGLRHYQEEDFCKMHRVIELYTEYVNYQYEPVAVFLAGGKEDSFPYNEYYILTDRRIFQEWKDNIKARAIYTWDVKWSPTDSYLLLSTCEYSRENGKLVLLARCKEQKTIQ